MLMKQYLLIIACVLLLTGCQNVEEMVQEENIRYDITTNVEEIGKIDTTIWTEFISTLDKACEQCESYYRNHGQEDEAGYGVLDTTALWMSIKVNELKPEAIKIIDEYTQVDLEKLIEEKNKTSESYVYTKSGAYHIGLSNEAEQSELKISYNGIRLNNQQIQQQIDDLCGEAFMLTGISIGYKNTVYEISSMSTEFRLISEAKVRYQIHQDNETGKISRMIGVFTTEEELSKMVVKSKEILPLVILLNLEENEGKQLQDEIEQIARREKNEVKTQIPMGEYELSKVNDHYDIIKFEMILPQQ